MSDRGRPDPDNCDDEIAGPSCFVRAQVPPTRRSTCSSAALLRWHGKRQLEVLKVTAVDILLRFLDVFWFVRCR